MAAHLGLRLIAAWGFPAASGRLLKIWLAALPSNHYAVINPDRNCLLAHGGNELWRYLAWRELPEGSNVPILHPLERFRADGGADTAWGGARLPLTCSGFCWAQPTLLPLTGQCGDKWEAPVMPYLQVG